MQQLGAGEVVQRLKTLAALPVDQDLIPYTHKAAQSSITFNSNGYDCIFQPPWVLGMHTIHKHTQKQKTINTKKEEEDMHSFKLLCQGYGHECFTVKVKGIPQICTVSFHQICPQVPNGLNITIKSPSQFDLFPFFQLNTISVIYLVTYF